MKTILRAPLLTLSGYGVHSRQVFEYLENSSMGYDIECQPVMWGQTSWMINPSMESGSIGRIMQKTAKSEEISDISFQVQLPDEWDSNLARVNIGITAAVETDKCNPAWIPCCNKMDAVIVPSNHAKEVLENSGDLSVKVYVVPEWFYPEITQESENSFLSDYDFGTRFNFLIVSQLTGQNSETDRKNIFNTIKWMCEEFDGSNDVGIVLKTNHGKGTKIDRHLTRRLLDSTLSQINVNNRPKIHFLHGNLTTGEICSLYKNKSIKSLVNLTRGEGFGLPILEAAASGLPTITTGWSAHTEFLSLGKFISVEKDLVQIPAQKVDGRIFVDGLKWADPSEQDFKKKIRKFYEKSEMPTDWAKELSVKIRDVYCREAVIKRYDEVIREILEK